MAKPPPSLVLRAPKMTTAQAVQQARAQQARFNGGLPNPNALPNLTNISPTGATVGSGGPVHVNRRGLVTNPAGSAAALTAGLPRDPAPAKPVVKPHVTVTVHPSGKIEIKHGAPASPAAPTAPTAPAASTASVAPQTRPKAAPARVPAPDIRNPSAAPTAPAAAQLSVQDQAQNILDPVKQSILDAINQRVGAQQSAITNYAKDLAGMMGQYAPEAGAAYGNAETGQAAIDAALAQTLQGAGTSGQADLAGKLAQINADPGTAARINGAAGATTQGALGAAAGRGAASLSQLVGAGANAQDYGAKLPGLAGLYGLQATKSAQAQGTTDTANAVASLEQKLPDVIQTLKTDANQNKQLRFEHGVALLQANGGVVTPQIKSLLGGALPVGMTAKGKAAAAASAPKVNSTLSKAYGVQTDDQGRAIVGKDGNPIPYPTAGTTAPKVNVALSKAYGILVDNTGSPILHQGKPVRLPSASTSTGKYHGLSAATYQEKQAQAAGLARIAHAPTPDGHPPVSWQQYLTGALNHKVPFWVAIQEGKRVYSPAEIKLGLIPGQGKK